jgi:hypothetical protein
VTQTAPTKRLGVRLTDDEFHRLNGAARSYKMPVREFLEFMVQSYLESMHQNKVQ